LELRQPEASRDITRLLQAWESGDAAARDALFSRLYPELKKIARRQLAHAAGATLQATDLAHETYLRLAERDDLSWASRLQFFALAAQIARQVLVDGYRRRSSQKRGGLLVQGGIDLDALAPEGGDLDLLALDEALTRLAGIDPEASRTVELRFFGGLTIPEIAAYLGTSEATVSRRWAMARAWLRRELGGGGAR
jgi:RNA polymerase sigma factor (TIGR02999 family)